VSSIFKAITDDMMSCLLLYQFSKLALLEKISGFQVFWFSGLFIFTFDWTLALKNDSLFTFNF